MQALGQAKLVQTTNAQGSLVKAWDLRPFGGDLLALGLVASPLPPDGTTVDRTLPNGRILRIDAGNGGVFEVAKGSEPPAVGTTGGKPMQPAAGGISSLISPKLIAVAVGLVFAYLKFVRRRR